jgi:Uma2 family endonuclease
MATTTTLPLTTQPNGSATPALQKGDHLTREEFERRYDAATHVKRAELIDGMVHIPSPVRFGHHGKPHFALIGWLSRYWTATPGIDGGDNASLRLDLNNMPQPDCFLIILPQHGGRVRIDEDDYIVGGPELVAEVAASSVSYDLHEKLRAYLRNGVQEYLVWRVEDRAFDWFVNRNNRFELAAADGGIHRSTVFPGLWLDAPALIRGDKERVAQVVDQGLSQPEYTEFRQQLLQKHSG